MTSVIDPRRHPEEAASRPSRRTRLPLILAAIALAAAGPKPRVVPPSALPVATVQALYASLPRPTPTALLTSSLRLLFRRDAARTERNLDFEWLSGGQERPEITHMRLRTTLLRGDRAEVEASFENLGERRLRRFDLVRVAGRWLVNDCRLNPENGKLSDFLQGKG